MITTKHAKNAKRFEIKDHVSLKSAAGILFLCISSLISPRRVCLRRIFDLRLPAPSLTKRRGENHCNLGSPSLPKSIHEFHSHSIRRGGKMNLMTWRLPSPRMGEGPEPQARRGEIQGVDFLGINAVFEVLNALNLG